MAVITPPIFLQAGSHPADSVRRALGLTVVERNSILLSGDWAITQNGTPNMSVNVAEGRGYVKGTEATYQGGYLCESQGVTNLAITAANATNPRIDLIVARVKDAAYSGATNTFSLEVVTGTAAASPVAPVTPVDSYVLASIAVAAAVTSILTANITDLRSNTTNNSGRLAGVGGVIVCDSTTRPGAPTTGMEIFETDTGKVLAYYGAAWIEITNTAQSWTSYTPTLANITIGTGGTNVGRWRRVGADVEFAVVVTLGSAGIAIGTAPTINLPVAADSIDVNFIVGSTTLYDATGPLYLCPTVLQSTVTAEPRVIGTLGALNQITSTNPFTWAVNDRIYFRGRYRAASAS